MKEKLYRLNPKSKWQNPNDKSNPNVKIQNIFGHLYLDEKN